MKKRKRKAVYAASFDPITYGHLDIIKRMAPLYDDLILFVAEDMRKTYTFTPEERMAIVKELVSDLPNVTVMISTNCYAVKHIKSIGAQVIIRGLRNEKDFRDELLLSDENRKICPDIETIWVPCLPSLLNVSSSIIKEHMGLDIEWKKEATRFTPLSIVQRLNEKFVLKKARKHWESLMQSVGNPENSDLIFGKLVAQYSESYRGYHDLEHIVNMLDELEFRKIALKDPIAAKFAIWYHDYVYDTGAKARNRVTDNEARSVASYKKDAKMLGLSESFNNRVGKLIMVTTHKNKPSNPDAQFVADLDMAILGKPKEIFDEYEAGIHKEYSWIPDENFYSARSNFLESVLNRPNIYLTKLFQDAYESSARKNIRRSIRKLKNQI